MKVSQKARKESKIPLALFHASGALQTKPYRKVQEASQCLQNTYGPAYTAGNVVAISLLHKAYYLGSQALFTRLPRGASEKLNTHIDTSLGAKQVKKLFLSYVQEFPSTPLYTKKISPQQELVKLAGTNSSKPITTPFWETIIVRIMNINPAMEEFSYLVHEKNLAKNSTYLSLFQEAHTFFQGNTLTMGGKAQNLIDILLEPARRHPHSILDQLTFIAKTWGDFLDADFLNQILRGIDYLKEEVFSPAFVGGGPAEVHAPDLGFISEDYEGFSEDKAWMAEVVMLAKNSLVWLYQLSQKYERSITRLDQIPDEELDELKKRGFSALWLIGLWERSTASQKIKQWCGNPDAAPSAYSLKGYYIAHNIGGYEAMANLRHRCAERGIRLASDMVPNHTGIDSDWVINHPERFLQTDYPPFPSYTYNSANLLDNSHVGVYLEDHYYNQSDAAVTFKRVNFDTGETTYMYHGNDGTSMPWNDTAQLDYLNPETREAVIQVILDVARNFSIIRFDAAMTLAKKHIQRLWFPKPGDGGVIASRAAHGLTTEAFNAAIPKEFWREVVDRVATEVPDCLLLAEAFWMMEGFFVRTLGMHRVYNSAFMHMLKNEDNQKFRDMIKETIAFDPGILQRYVNFMSNPDEETAIEQFGDGDKYFGVATILATLPGLPMVGHGQFEGFYEKYGMEYHRSYYDEHENQHLLETHSKLISPLFQQRASFAGAQHFALYDFNTYHGVNESVYAYTNMGRHGERSLVLVNNSYYETEGSISHGAPVKRLDSGTFDNPHIFNRLGCTSTDNRFLICYAPREGLYYLWPTEMVAHGSLHFHLTGYQSKVFLNFHEVHDTTGAYRKLWELHQGSGIKDIHIGALLLQLQPAHAKLKALLALSSPDEFEAMLRSPGTVELFLDAKRPYMKDFLNTLCENLSFDQRVAEQALEHHEAIVREMASLKLFDSDYSTALYNLTVDMQPDIITLLHAWAIIAPITPADALPFGKLLITSELYKTYSGCEVDTSEEIESLVSAALSAGNWFDAEKTPRQLLEELFWVDDVIEALHIHTYQGKTYYKKEAFAPLVVLLNVSAMVQQRKHRRAITNLTKKWLVAESASRYEVPRILAGLEA